MSRPRPPKPCDRLMRCHCSHCWQLEEDSARCRESLAQRSSSSWPWQVTIGPECGDVARTSINFEPWPSFCVSARSCRERRRSSFLTTTVLSSCTSISCDAAASALLTPSCLSRCCLQLYPFSFKIQFHPMLCHRVAAAGGIHRGITGVNISLIALSLGSLLALIRFLVSTFQRLCRSFPTNPSTIGIFETRFVSDSRSLLPSPHSLAMVHHAPVD